MTDKAKNDLNELCADILRKTGIPIGPTNEILPLLVYIREMQDQCIAAIKVGLPKSAPSVKMVQISTGRHAILHGLSSWGFGAILAGIGILIMALNYTANSNAQKEFEHTKALYSAMQADIQRVNDLGFLKNVEVKEDAKGKYFILQNATGHHETQAGKDFILIQDGKDSYAKIYTAYFK